MMLEAERSVQQVWYGAEKRRYAMHLILRTSVVEGFDVVTLEVQDGTLSLCSVTQMRVDGEEGECVTYRQKQARGCSATSTALPRDDLADQLLLRAPALYQTCMRVTPCMRVSIQCWIVAQSQLQGTSAMHLDRPLLARHH